MAAITIGSRTATIPDIPVRASVARTTLQAVLELVAAFMIASQVSLTAAVALPAGLMFATAAALLLVVTFTGQVGRTARILELVNAGLLVALLAGSVFSR